MSASSRKADAAAPVERHGLAQAARSTRGALSRRSR